MSNLPEVIEEQISKFSVERGKAEAIASNYVPLMSGAQELGNKLKSLEKGNEDHIEEAKAIRIALGKIAASAEAQKKEDKKDILLAGRFVDGLFNTVNGYARISQKEAKEIECHFENLERERIEKLQTERSLELAKYGGLEYPGLGEMSDAVWNNYLAGTKLNFEAKKRAEYEAEMARLESERKNAIRQERMLNIAQYAQFKDGSEKLVEEMSEEEFSELVNTLQTREEKYRKDQEAIKAERDRLASLESDRRKKLLEEEKARLELESKSESVRLKTWVSDMSIDKAPVSTKESRLIEEKFTAFKEWALVIINQNNQ